APITSEMQTAFLHKDALGSTRQATDYTGATKMDMLFYPWGDVWSMQGVLYDQGFAGFLNAQDTDEVLYGTPNREYAHVMGRWLSPDPAGTKAVTLSDPQTWNMYAYTRNNPTTLTDPSGLYTWSQNCKAADEACQARRQAFRDSLKALQQARDYFKKGSTEYKRIDRVLSSYGEEGKGGPGIAFGHVDNFAGQFNPRTSTITFDTQRIGGDARNFAVLSGHEGEHYADRGLPLNPFQREYRGYQISSWAAQGVGFPSYSTEPNTGEWPEGRGTLWHQTWSPENRQMFFTLGVLQTWKDFYSNLPGFRGSPICCPMDPIEDQ
ncbi:MAG TPA: RHS repeat-associated core domain-containing protein, partial [Terriglobia bacterium]|nr:RHS repeat-associated core domain-containing protein [Terriglobia bacterium]